MPRDVKKSQKLTSAQQIDALYQKLAGDKLERVEASKQQFLASGKSLHRSMADALEKHKCPNYVTDEHNT